VDVRGSVVPSWLVPLWFWCARKRYRTRGRV